MAVSRKTKHDTQHKRATIGDVASLAGVSPSTVSLYLRRPEEVSTKLAVKIQAAIDELPYVPNKLAGSLSSAKSNTLCALIPSLSNTFFAGTVRSMQNECEQAGYTLLIGNTDYSQKQEEHLVRTFLGWSPAGIILTGRNQSDATIRLIESANIPVAQMWDIGSHNFGLQIGFDNKEAGILAAKHLVQSGCQHIVFMGARLEDDLRAQYRAEGYMQIIAEHGLKSRVISLPTSFSTQDAGLSIAAELATNPIIDGIICSNDSIALGVLFEAQRRGIHVPDRLSIVGFGDLEFAQSTNPPLTSIRPNGETIGKLAIRHILNYCEGNETFPENKIIDVRCELIPRGSTRIVV